MAYPNHEIKSFVANLHRELQRVNPKFSKKPPYDVRLAIEMVGGEIDDSGPESQDYMNAEGKVYVKEPLEDRRFTIELANLAIDQRKRFTLAHELGHIMLHFYWPDQQKWLQVNAGQPGQDRKVVMFRKGRNRMEYEANYFAACFLMPEDQLKEDFAKTTKDMDEPGPGFDYNRTTKHLAEKYNVSFTAMQTRCKFLELIPW